MINKEISEKINKAAKWSSITEVIVRIISPITNMILARIISPEAFGVVATVTMIVSFVDMFTDAGFQKYLIQNNFNNEDEKYRSANVAFWTNLFVSLFLWGVITIFCEQIATLVGNPGLGNVIVISCIQLPLTAFSSIHIALNRRNFSFKTLFWMRIATVCLPFIITIPLAFMGFSYWALIIGIICGQISSVIILTIKSNWKPKCYYCLSVLKKMIAFSIWSLVEAISIWLTAWVDVFLISNYFNDYYLGLYKTSITLVNSLMTLVTASIVPVLFSALSRLQNDEIAFKDVFLKFQRITAYLILPMGVGTFLFADTAKSIFLGEKWNGAENIIGIWSLTSAIMIVFSFLNSEVYRSKGRPKLSFLAQILHLIFLIPVCLISLKYEFETFVFARSLIRFQGVIVGFIIMHITIRFSVYSILKNNIRPFICTLIMSCLALIFKHFSKSIFQDLVSIGLCILFYIIVVYVTAPNDIKLFKNFIKSR